jgi:hypothetical protein
VQVELWSVRVLFELLGFLLRFLFPEVAMAKSCARSLTGGDVCVYNDQVLYSPIMMRRT